MLLRSGAVSDEHRDGVKKREAMEGGRERRGTLRERRAVKSMGKKVGERRWMKNHTVSAV